MFAAVTQIMVREKKAQMGPVEQQQIYVKKLLNAYMHSLKEQATCKA